MKIGIDMRVSTNDQAKEEYPHNFACAKLDIGIGSLEVQREYPLQILPRAKFIRRDRPLQFYKSKTKRRDKLKSFTKREGLEIFKVYQDDGISGYSSERPALKLLVKDAKQKKFDLDR